MLLEQEPEARASLTGPDQLDQEPLGAGDDLAQGHRDPPHRPALEQERQEVAVDEVPDLLLDRMEACQLLADLLPPARPERLALGPAELGEGLGDRPRVEPRLQELFALCPDPHIAVLNLDVDDIRAAANRAILDVLLAQPCRQVNRHHDLFATRFAQIAGLIVHYESFYH